MSKGLTQECRWVDFKNGNLKGISLFTTGLYSKTYENGNADKEMMDNILNGSPSGKVIFDVGAFIGASSLVFSKMIGKKGAVISFEPNLYNRKRMEKNLAKNSELGKRVQLFPCALSDSNGEMKMLLSKNIDLGNSSTSRIEGAHSKIKNEELPNGFVEVDVDSKKLDDFIQEIKIIPDIIKIDIEGAEHLLLLGALETLRKHHPTLYIEIHSEYCAIRCYEILRDCGYGIEIINEEDDNRIMIKAIHSTDSGIPRGLNDLQECCLKSQNTCDSLFRQIKKMDYFTKEFVDTKAMLADKNELLNKISYELDQKDNELRRLLNSNSWRVTSPFRSFVTYSKDLRRKLKGRND